MHSAKLHLVKNKSALEAEESEHNGFLDEWCIVFGTRHVENEAINPYLFIDVNSSYLRIWNIERNLILSYPVDVVFRSDF